MTGLIHNADKYGNTNKENLPKKHLKGNSVVQRQTTPFIWSNEPLVYLGVQLAMNINWKHQFTYSTECLKGRLEGLSASYALSRQTHDAIHKAIIPGLAYSISVTQCTAV
jgi:hypothetical protein